jgi:hypothetical protein
MKTQEPVAVINGTSELVGLVMAVVVAGGNVLNTLWARAKVTPTVSRRDADNRFARSGAS